MVEGPAAVATAGAPFAFAFAFAGGCINPLRRSVSKCFHRRAQRLETTVTPPAHGAHRQSVMILRKMPAHLRAQPRGSTYALSPVCRVRRFTCPCVGA